MTVYMVVGGSKGGVCFRLRLILRLRLEECIDLTKFTQVIAAAVPPSAPGIQKRERHGFLYVYRYDRINYRQVLLRIIAVLDRFIPHNLLKPMMVLRKCIMLNIKLSDLTSALPLSSLSSIMMPCREDCRPQVNQGYKREAACPKWRLTIKTKHR